RAFHLLRPIIQGLSEADITPTVTREELARTMDFLALTFTEDDEQVQNTIPADILNEEFLRDGIRTEEGMAAVRGMDSEHQDFVKRIKIKKFLNRHINIKKDFGEEVILGAVVRMVPGNLGIDFVGSNDVDKAV